MATQHENDNHVEVAVELCCAGCVANLTDEIDQKGESTPDEIEIRISHDCDNTKTRKKDIFGTLSVIDHNRFTIQFENPIVNISNTVWNSFTKKHWYELSEYGHTGFNCNTPPDVPTLIQRSMTKNDDTRKEVWEVNVEKIAINSRANAWLSCDLRLDDIKIKEQNFTISGWINVIWKEPKHSPLYNALKECYDASKESKFPDVWAQTVWHYRVRKKPKMRVLDLRKMPKITYFLPIDACRIFDQLSQQWVKYKDPPYLVFDGETGVVRTEYHISAQLSQHLALGWFPFDKQFLSIKLRWNVDYYKILHWETGYRKSEDKPKDPNLPNIPKIKDIDESVRFQNMFYDAPLKISVIEQLLGDIVLHEAWIGMATALEYREQAMGLRFALIRLRFTRNPNYFMVEILLPLFLIVLSGFSVFVIPVDDVGDRLGVSLTVLLAFTAFQSLRAAQLPITAEIGFLDVYIALAYFVQTCIILDVVWQKYHEEGEYYEYEAGGGWMLFWAWIGVSLVYIVNGIIFSKCIYFCDCCRDQEGITKECGLCDCVWNAKSRSLMSQWDSARSNRHPFLMKLSIPEQKLPSHAPSFHHSP
eukprot:202570_1